MRFAITRDGQKYQRKRKAKVVNEHIEPCSGFRFIIADARDLTITPVDPAENCHTTANTSIAQYCGMSRKAKETRNKLSSRMLIAFGLKPKRTNKNVKGLERWELTVWKIPH